MLGFSAGDATSCEDIWRQSERLGARPQGAPRRDFFVAAPPAFLAEVRVAGGARARPQSARRVVAPANRMIRSSVVIEAPLERVWAALNDHSGMARWIGADEFFVVKPGVPDEAGHGAERVLVTQGREVVQQVTRISPPKRINYRAIAGTPFAYHNGVVEVHDLGARTRVDWSIRFRTRPRFLADAVQAQLNVGIHEMLNSALKRLVELGH